MNMEEMLKDEIQRLRALEGGLASAFDLIDGRARCGRLAVSIVMLIERADRHLDDLERICHDEGWPLGAKDSPAADPWQDEVSTTILDAEPGDTTDAACAELLDRAVRLRIPFYESAQLFALCAERPTVARTLRRALEDEHSSLERLSGDEDPRVGASMR